MRSNECHSNSNVMWRLLTEYTSVLMYCALCVCDVRRCLRTLEYIRADVLCLVCV